MLNRLTEKDYEESYRVYLSHGESLNRAAREMGLARSSFTARIQNMPDAIKERINQEFAAKRKEPVEESDSDLDFKIQNLSAAPEKFAREKQLIIGDRHQAPGVETVSLRRINDLLRENKYDRVILMGDWWDMRSLSFFDRNDSISGKMKPSFKTDIDAGIDGLDIVLDGCESPVEFIEGNHEYRIFRYEDCNPETEGMLSDYYMNALCKRGVRYHEFRSVVMINGVGYVHVPYGAYGKEIRGKYPETVIGREATCDLIFAHTHRQSFYSSPKIGPRTAVNCLNVGCSLADGHVESYARHSLTGWKYGVCEVVTRDSEIESYSFISMKELEHRYR